MFLLLQHCWSTLTILSSDLRILTELCISCSVTVVAFVRLVYLTKANPESANVTTNLSNIVIWTGVEVNMSLVCGQYKHSAGLHRSLLSCQWRIAHLLMYGFVFSISMSSITRPDSHTHLRQVQAPARAHIKPHK